MEVEGGDTCSDILVEHYAHMSYLTKPSLCLLETNRISITIDGLSLRYSRLDVVYRHISSVSYIYVHLRLFMKPI